MLDRGVLRWGGAAAMVGAVLSLIFNLLHPRPGDTTVEAELQMIADSGIWVFDHYMLAWALAFALVGLVAIGWSYAEGPAQTWGRFAVASAIGGVTVAFVTLAVDGMAMKEIADNWAANKDPSAETAAHIALSLFVGTIGSLFGLTAVLYGIAGLNSVTYPRWLGWLALLAGLDGLLVASIVYLSGPNEFALTVLFLIGSLAFTVWLFLMGWSLWKSNETPAAPPPDMGVREPALR